MNSIDGYCLLGKEESKSVVCYTCHQPGHKSPECPNKNQISQPKQSDGKKKLGLRSGNRPFNTNWVAVQGDTPMVQGKVNGSECSIVPDILGQRLVVPGCLVYETQILLDVVKVRGATGVPVKLSMAEVTFEIEGRTFIKRVAVVQEGMLNGKVLFAVSMNDSMAKRLLLGAAPV